jgi:hypothetical protein
MFLKVMIIDLAVLVKFNEMVKDTHIIKFSNQIRKYKDNQDTKLNLTKMILNYNNKKQYSNLQLNNKETF